MSEEQSVVDAVSLAGSVHDMSVWGLFLQADWVVKSVIILLIVASFWTWAVVFDKILRLRRLNMESTEFENAFWSGQSLDTLHKSHMSKTGEPMAAVFVAAMSEWKRANLTTLTRGAKDAVIQRIERVMSITVDREMERLERYLIFLASTGATAPFIGLFGTVWGIMNSFQGIAMSQNTSLAAVAPGIAEALFATALGLVAAIPAVVAYNKIAADMDRYAGRLESFAGEFTAIISRQLDEKISEQRAQQAA